MRELTVLVSLPLAVLSLASVHAQEVRTGAAAFGTWEADAPGVSRHIRPADLPAADPFRQRPRSAGFQATWRRLSRAPQGKMPDVPKGFAVQVFARVLKQPRVIRIAPNGDVFVAESGSGRVLVFAADAARGAPAMPEVFAENLDRPYGIVFHPPSDPQYVYVAAANQVVRFPYNGDRKATGPAEVVIPNIPTKRHWTRDLAVSRDGRRLFVSIGSSSNVAAGMPDKTRRKFRPTKRRMGLARPGARKRTGPLCACSTRKVRTSAIMRPACATAPAWPCSQAPTPCGAPATNATISAPIWCPTS